MKRLPIIFLTSIFLPACSGEVADHSSDAGALSNDNVRTSGHADAGTGPNETGSSTSRPADSVSSAHTTQGRSDATSSLESTLATSTGGTSGLTGPSNPSSGSSSQVSSEPSQGSGAAQSTTTQPTGASSTVADQTNDVASDASQSSSGETSSSDSTPVEAAFDIELRFVDDSESSDAVREAFERAEAFWESLIVGDLPDITTRRQGCNGPDIYVEGDIDDLQIFVAVGPIDGPDGVLGAAGPCLGRPTWQGGLPLAGFMQFDVDDLERYASQGRLDEVIIHEMGHVLGFGGVLWQEQGYLADASDENVRRDTHFTGEKAIAAFNLVGGNAYTDAKVPVENTGGQGTANGHWREEVMGNEMMTSYMTHMEAVLSTVTLAALEDMGYEVDYSKAGGYEWPPPDERNGPFSLRTEPALAPIDLGNDILDIPYVTID